MQTFAALHPIRAKRLAQYIKHQSGLLLYSPLNEVDGSTTYNRAPATLGTLNGTITGATIGADGLLGKAYSFDGANDETSFGDVPSISDATSLSVVIIIKTNNLTADHHIFGNGAGSAGILFFADDVGSVTGRTNTFKIYIEDDGSDSANIEGASGSNTGSFLMVGFSFSPSSSGGLHLYINGVEDANSPVDTTNVGNVGLSNNAVKVGVDSGGNKDLDGFAQHLAVFNTALTTAQHLKMARIAGLA